MKNVDEQKLKAELEASKDLQIEFGGDAVAYVAYMQAAAEGRVRSLSGGMKSSVVPVSGPGPAAVDDEALKQEFSASADLQSEFGNDVNSYIAFKKANVAGRTKVCSGHGVVAFSSSAPATKE